MPEEIRKIKRSEFATFLNTGTSELPVWARMGKGITGQTVNYNPEVTNEKYINEDSASPSVESYAPTIPTPQTAFVGEPVFDFVDDIRKNRKIGTACETEVLMVYIYDSTESGEPLVTNYASEKQKVAIQIDDFGGDSSTVLNYTVNFVGDPVIGSVVITAGAPVFTAE